MCACGLEGSKRPGKGFASTFNHGRGPARAYYLLPDGQMTESVMYPMQADHAGDSRLRFVFDDEVASFDLPANATYEDIARTWSELAPQYHSKPVAIDVTLAAPQDSL